MSNSVQRPLNSTTDPDGLYDTEPVRRENDEDDDEREATEMGQLSRNGSTNPVNMPSELLTESDTGDAAQRVNKHHMFDGLRRSWRHYIQLHVPHADCRDHLANERTFLAYQRTSLALSMMGIVITQLFGLQFSSNADAIFGYHVLGKPLGGLFQAAAIVVILIGGHRFWRQQMYMARGRVIAGGWEIWTIIGFMFILIAIVFGLLVAADVSK